MFCRKGAPLYNLSSINQCQKCFVVQLFHLECSKGVASCPNCNRLKARNLNWQIAMTKAQRDGDVEVATAVVDMAPSTTEVKEES